MSARPALSPVDRAAPGVPESDAALARRVALGDATALGPLYERHKTTVYRFSLLWSGQAATAADVTQDVFLHLLDHAADFDPARGRLAPWLLGVARNFVHRRHGAHARFVPHDDDAPMASAEPTPDLAVERARDLVALRAAIAALPPHYRDVLVLVELAERTYAEAAAICGCELNTVRSRLSRARAQLAQQLAPRASSPHPAPDIAP